MTSDDASRQLLNARELAAMLGIGLSTFHQRQRDGLLKMFLVSRPMGQRRYSRALVERYISGQSMALFGRGSRTVRE